MLKFEQPLKACSKCQEWRSFHCPGGPGFIYYRASHLDSSLFLREFADRNRRRFVVIGLGVEA